MLFYGGIACGIIVIIISIVIIVTLAKGKNELQRKFDTEIKK